MNVVDKNADYFVFKRFSHNVPVNYHSLVVIDDFVLDSVINSFSRDMYCVGKFADIVGLNRCLQNLIFVIDKDFSHKMFNLANSNHYVNSLNPCDKTSLLNVVVQRKFER